eukprot:gene6298-47070_t
MALNYPPDVVFLASIVLLNTAGCVNADGAWEGFSNKG